jgi:RecA/RadA recombinase
MDQNKLTTIKLFSILEDAIDLIEYLIETDQTSEPMSEAGYQQAMEKVARIRTRSIEIKSNLGLVAPNGEKRQ